MEKRIGIASDHGGRELKKHIIEYLKSNQYDVIDYGVPVDDSTSVDYPDYAEKLSQDISKQELSRGILICGTGIGMSIAANKVPGIRATLVWDEFTAKMSRAHNDSNVLCLGERVLNHYRAVDFVKLWLETEFEGSRHQRRLDKITALEK